MLTTRSLVSIFSTAMMVLGIGTVSAQNFPTKPVRIVAGAAGGSSDPPTRLIAQGITGPLGQPVIVENRGGLSIKEEVVLKALPDGYTLLMAGSSLWIGALLVKTSYDPVKDFSPVTLVSQQVAIVAVHASVPVNSIKELIALAKAKPGVLNYGNGGAGGGSHLNTELFKTMAGVDIVSIDFKGGGAALLGLVGGQIQMGIFDAGLVAPHVKSGKLRALAVTSAEPSVLAPGLPTMAASGLPGFEAVGYAGLLAPAKTPAAIISRLNQEIVRFLNRPDVKERFLGIGEEVVASSPEQFAATITADIARKSKVIKDAGIRTERF